MASANKILISRLFTDHHTVVCFPLTTRAVPLPKRTETGLITESDRSGPNHRIGPGCAGCATLQYLVTVLYSIILKFRKIEGDFFLRFYSSFHSIQVKLTRWKLILNEMIQFMVEKSLAPGGTNPRGASSKKNFISYVLRRLKEDIYEELTKT